MTHEEFLNERRFDNDHIFGLDTLVRENLKKGYVMEERFEEQLHRIDQAGAEAFALINNI